MMGWRAAPREAAEGQQPAGGACRPCAHAPARRLVPRARPARAAGGGRRRHPAGRGPLCRQHLLGRRGGARRHVLHGWVGREWLGAVRESGWMDGWMDGGAHLFPCRRQQFMCPSSTRPLSTAPPGRFPSHPQPCPPCTRSCCPAPTRTTPRPRRRRCAPSAPAPPAWRPPRCTSSRPPSRRRCWRCAAMRRFFAAVVCTAQWLGGAGHPACCCAPRVPAAAPASLLPRSRRPAP